MSGIYSEENFKKNIDESWLQLLSSEFRQDYFIQLLEFLNNEPEPIFPPPNEIFSWTRTHLDSVSVVILGQDPYPTKGVAHGLAFSTRDATRQKSLDNIFKEIVSNGFREPSHGDLSKWCERGVLLLNSVLTVREGQPNSHKDQGWERLTDAVLTYLSENRSNLVFMLWGRDAQKKKSLINENNHLVLECPHPSPLSAKTGFFGSKCFFKCNEYLSRFHKPKIDWSDV